MWVTTMDFGGNSEALHTVFPSGPMYCIAGLWFNCDMLGAVCCQPLILPQAVMPTCKTDTHPPRSYQMTYHRSHPRDTRPNVEWKICETTYGKVGCSLQPDRPPQRPVRESHKKWKVRNDCISIFICGSPPHALTTATPPVVDWERRRGTFRTHGAPV